MVVTEVTAHIFHIFKSFCEQKFVYKILKPLEQNGCMPITPEEKRLVNCLISLSLNDDSSCLTLRERDTAGILQRLLLLVLVDLRELGDLHFTFQSPNTKTELYFVAQHE